MSASEKIRELLESGKRHYAAGNFGAAANDFTAIVAIDQGNTEAKGYLHMIDEIQNYRNTDLLNP